MKVWLVIRGDYEDNTVVAVWDSRKAAETDCARHKATDTQAVPYGWRVEEHEVYSTGSDQTK